MSEKVSSFAPIQLGAFRYLYLLVTWNDFATPLREELEKQLEPFGEVLGLDGKVIQAFKSMTANTYQEVLTKRWSDEVRQRMEEDQDPFMLIVDKSFDEFEPQDHSWSLIWFSDYWRETDCIYRLFATLARKTRGGQDVIDYLRSVAEKKKVGKWAKLVQYVELKPKVFGVSLDVGAILEDLSEES